MYEPNHIANFMLDRADEEERPISPMKLLKLVYIAYGWYLALFGEKLFEEPIYAWKHGPVIESLYHEFKHFRAAPITQPSVDFDLDTFDINVPRIDKENEPVNLILERVWDAYKQFSATALRNKTHERGSPWHAVYEEGKPNIQIPDELIRNHFIKKIRQYLENAK